MIDRILERAEFQRDPPVLVDIGASGAIHDKWKRIAKHAICIAFEPDDREMSFTQNQAGGFRKFVTINRIVTDREVGEVDFYFTQSPFCSSTLEPDLAKLSKWPFQELFVVQRKTKLKAVRLSEALSGVGVERIDWLKIDTQGTDLRIFKSLPDNVRDNLLVAEFEPGIIDAYKGEDKLHELIEYMSDSRFYMSSIEIKGVERVEARTSARFPMWRRRALRSTHKASPGWGEVSYMNKMADVHDTRSNLLAYVFALLEKQFGFACEIAEKAERETGDPLFKDLKRHALKQLSIIQLKWPFFALKNRLDRAFNSVFR